MTDPDLDEGQRRPGRSDKPIIHDWSHPADGPAAHLDRPGVALVLALLSSCRTSAAVSPTRSCARALRPFSPAASRSGTPPSAPRQRKSEPNIRIGQHPGETK